MDDADKKTLKIIGITCGVLAMLSCFCGIGMFVFGGAAIVNAAPKQSTDAFLDELARGDFVNARQRMNGGYQQTHDVPAFQRAVAALPALTTHTDRTMTNVQIQPQRASIGGNLTTPQGTVPVLFQCSKLGEHWYIDSVAVGGMPLQ